MVTVDRDCRCKVVPAERAADVALCVLMRAPRRLLCRAPGADAGAAPIVVAVVVHYIGRSS